MRLRRHWKTKEYTNKITRFFFFHTASKLLRFKILETHQVGGQIAYDGVRTEERVIAWLSGEHGKYLYVCLSRNCGISK